MSIPAKPGGNTISRDARPEWKVRIGPAGHLYNCPYKRNVPVPKRFQVVLDHVAGHGFPLYALTPRIGIHSQHFPVFGQEAARRGLEVHYLWPSTHPFNKPVYQDPLKINGSAEAHAKRIRNAEAAGIPSYTIHPPLKTACTLEEFGAELAAIRDRLEPGIGTRIHVMNALTTECHLSDAEELGDYCRSHEVTPAIHAGHDHACTRRQRSHDQWHELLDPLPRETLFVYANMAWTPDGITIQQHGHDELATPRLAPLLEAIQDRDARLLIQGDYPEADALGALRLQAVIQGIDLDSLPVAAPFLRRNAPTPSAVET